MGDGRTVKEVAAELACDWHAVSDAVNLYGEALLEADRKRLSQTSAIGLDETSFVRLSGNRTDYATTVADVENQQILPTSITHPHRSDPVIFAAGLDVAVLAEI